MGSTKCWLLRNGGEDRDGQREICDALGIQPGRIGLFAFPLTGEIGRMGMTRAACVSSDGRNQEVPCKLHAII